jgi:hypothetical protein
MNAARAIIAATIIGIGLWAWAFALAHLAGIL